MVHLRLRKDAPRPCRHPEKDPRLAHDGARAAAYRYETGEVCQQVLRPRRIEAHLPRTTCP